MSKPWFVPKKYGYGLTPVTWEGWVCTFACAVACIGFILLIS